MLTLEAWSLTTLLYLTLPTKIENPWWFMYLKCKSSGKGVLGLAACKMGEMVKLSVVEKLTVNVKKQSAAAIKVISYCLFFRRLHERTEGASAKEENVIRKWWVVIPVEGE